MDVTAILMLLWTGGLVMPSYLQSQSESRGFDNIKAEADASQTRIQQINDTVAKLDAELQNANLVSASRGKAFIIDTIPDLVPEGVELSGYYLTESVNLRLTGAAVNPDVVQLFVTELQNSGLVDQPTANEPLPREASPYFDFEITARLRQES